MTRLLVVSPFLPPHLGGVEQITAWMMSSLPAHGFTVRTAGHDIAPGDGDVLWPSIAQPAGIPLPRPSRRAWRELCGIVAWSDVVLIQNAFWPLSNIAGAALRRVQRPGITLIHANAATPAHRSGILIRTTEAIHARSAAAAQLLVAPPLAISESSRAFVASHYHHDADVLPTPLPDSLPPIRSPRSRRDPLQIVFSGRLAPIKAPQIAVEACARARRRVPLELSIYGDGPMAPALRRAVPDWVTMHGAVSWRDAVDAVAAADVFISSSVTDNTQLSLLEAAAMGVPCVASDVGEASGYLAGALRVGVPTIADPDGLADALCAVALDYDTLSADAARRARKLRETHDSARVAEHLALRLTDAAERVVGGGGRPPTPVAWPR